MRLYEPAFVITNDEADRVLEGGCVGVEGDRIAYVGTPEEAPRGVEERIRLPSGVLMPGLIVAHTHLYGFFARGLAPSTPPRDFLAVLEGMWWRLDTALTLDDVYWSAMGAAVEALLCGTTTLMDHHASPSCIAGSLERIAQAVGQVGIRTLLSYEISDRHGHDEALRGLEENERAMLLASQRPGWLAARTGLHASFTLEDRTLDAVAERTNAVHVHVAEDEVDVRLSLQRHGEGVIARLARRGLLTPDTILVHGCHLSRQELDRIAHAGATLVHNPRSNMHNGVGTLDLGACAEAGVRLALGTDGMGQDPCPEMLGALLLHRHQVRSPSSGWDVVKDMYCRGNAEVASAAFGLPLGRLSVGAAADFIVRSYDPPTPLTTETWWAHQLFGLGHAPVERVVVGGRELVRGGEPVWLDLHAIRSACRAQAARLWARW